MKMRSFFFFSFFLFMSHAWAITQETTQQIADKVWHNECGGTKEGLTHWNKGENFASLGIGHFIWYPQGKKERFEETFPLLLAYMQKEGVALPPLLKKSRGCPWETKEAFYQDFYSPSMIELRQFLFETRELQAAFIIKRAQSSLALVIAACPAKDKEKVKKNIALLSKSPKGLYALIDYLHFKGTGISPDERYKGKGWGLLQVLRQMNLERTTSIKAFVASAKRTLIERVENAPTERNEQKWLRGWLNRVDTYLQ
jgi:hypothetical protein